MNDEERREYIKKEMEAIYEEFAHTIDQLLLLKYFLKDLIFVSKGEVPDYKKIKSILKKIK